MKQVSKFDGKNADDFLGWSSKLRVSLPLYSKSIFEIVQGSQRPSGLDNNQVTAREGWDDANHNLFSILYFTTSGPAFSAVRKFEGKTREDGVGHGQDAWAALREKVDGCSREALREAHRELETVKIRSDEDPDDFLYKKDRCSDRLNSVTPKEGPSDRRYEDIILQCLSPEYDRICQTHFEIEDCSLADIRWMMSKIYTGNLARSNSDSSRGIAGRGVAMQDLRKINCYYCNKCGHYKNDCADFYAAHQQNGRRRQRQHKQRGRDQPKSGGQHQQRGGGQMWCSYHKTTTHSNADCCNRPANRPSGNAHFAQVRPPSVSGVASSWDLSGQYDSDEKSCISFLAREVQPATKPSKTRVEEKRARPFGPVLTAATEGWRTRPWTFTPRAEQAISFGRPVAVETFGIANDEDPVEKALVAPSSDAVTSEDSANSNLAVPMAPAESLPGEVREPLSGGAPTPLSGGAPTPLLGGAQTLLSGGASTPLSRDASTPLSGEASTPLSGGASTPLSGGASTPLSGGASTPSGVRANDEEPVEKALMASSSVAVTSEDSANSNPATLMAPAESLLGEVREPLSGGAPTPLSGGASAPLSAGAPTPLLGGASMPLSGGGASTPLSGGASTFLSGGASTPSGVRASPETARPLPPPVPATARMGAAIRNKIHWPNVVTRRAAAELTGAVTRYRGICPNKNNNNNDDININNNNHATLAECFQPSTLHKLRQPGLYTHTDTLDDNNINNNSHAALAERFQPSTLHKLRQLGRDTNTGMPDTAHQLDAEAVPAEVAYTRTNTQLSCSGGGESDRVPNIFKGGMTGLRHHTS